VVERGCSFVISCPCIRSPSSKVLGALWCLTPDDVVRLERTLLVAPFFFFPLVFFLFGFAKDLPWRCVVGLDTANTAEPVALYFFTTFFFTRAVFVFQSALLSTITRLASFLWRGCWQRTSWRMLSPLSYPFVFSFAFFLEHCLDSYPLFIISSWCQT